MNLEEVLYQAFLQNYHLDRSNAAIHCGQVRFSPLTFRLAEQLGEMAERTYAEVMIVLGDRGVYEEDKGR